MNRSKKIIRTIVALCLLLVIAINVACQSDKSDSLADDKTSEQSQDWVKDEILQQLNELRVELREVKAEIAKLDNKIDAIPAGAQARAPRVVKGPDKVTVGDNVPLGNDSAKIAIVEFTDYQCPFCGRHNKDVFPKLKSSFIDKGIVKYYSRNYPLGFHAQAMNAAIAVNCAQSQGKYWDMHDLIFANQKMLNDSVYKSFASELDLDTAKFSACVADPGQKDHVNQEVAYGNSVGVSGTPKFFIGKLDGKYITDVAVVDGAQSYAAFSSAIKRLTN